MQWACYVFLGLQFQVGNNSVNDRLGIEQNFVLGSQIRNLTNGLHAYPQNIDKVQMKKRPTSLSIPS